MLWNISIGLRDAWLAEMDDVRGKAEARMMTKAIDDFRRISSRIDEIAICIREEIARFERATA